VLGQGAEITLLCEAANQDLPEEVEVQPLNVMSEVIPWADYFAMEVPREKVSDMRASLEQAGWVKLRLKAQVLISTPMPCGGVAECGVCAVRVKDDWKMACKDGPVFDLKDIPFS
jgi:dihydroorotate dehydrogenase electron transfer subunit